MMNKQTIEEIEILVSAKVDEAKKGLSKLIKDVKTATSNVSSEFQKMSKGGSFDGMKNGLSQVKQKASSVFNGMKQDMKSYDDSVKSTIKQQEYLKSKIADLQDQLNMADKGFEVGDTAKIEADIERLKNKLNDLQQQGDKGGKVGFVAKLKEKLKGLGSDFDNAKKKGNDFGKGIGNAFKNGIKSLKKFALSLLGIRQVFAGISRAASSYLSFDTQLSESIQNCWNALGSLLAPMLEYVVGLFSKLVSVVAAFVKALTGVDLVARANAKALNSQAKASNNASKSLSGIDDIDTLSSGSGSDNSTPQITTEAVDMSPIEAALERIKGILGQIFEPFKAAWETTGAGVIQSIQDMFISLKDLGASVGASIMEVWTNGTGQTIIENALLGWQQMFDAVGQFGEALKNAWSNNDNGTKILQNIADTFTIIQQAALRIGDFINKWVVSEGFQNALNLVFDVIEDISRWVKDLADWVLDMYDKYFKPVLEDKLIPAIDEVVTAISDVWATVEPVVNKIIDIIKKNLEPIISNLSDSIGGIIDTVKGVAQFISGVFTGDWDKAWTGIKNIFKGIWDALYGIIKAPINLIIGGVEFLVNAIISGVNMIKKALNKISFDIPDWVPVIGGEKWGFKLPLDKEMSIPRLATGTVAYETMPAVIGEYAGARSNPEIVSPVSMMKDSFRSVLNEFEFGGTRIETLRVDVAGENFYQGTVDYINTENSRKGVNIIKEV